MASEMLSAAQAAQILGVTEDEVRQMQERGALPDPVPYDLLEPVVKFRVDLEQAFRRKFDKRGPGVPASMD